MSKATKSTDTAETPTPKPAPAAKVSGRVPPVITEISAAVEMPEKTTNRGSKTLYPFEALEVGQSFGVKNKTAHGMASIVSNQNRKNRVDETDTDGNTVFETRELKGSDGKITEVPTDKPKTKILKHFFAVDCLAKDDPDGATVRVFRNV